MAIPQTKAIGCSKYIKFVTWLLYKSGVRVVKETRKFIRCSIIPILDNERIFSNVFHFFYMKFIFFNLKKLFSDIRRIIYVHYSI